jgi:hypothetical protein
LDFVHHCPCWRMDLVQPRDFLQPPHKRALELGRCCPALCTHHRTPILCRVGCNCNECQQHQHCVEPCRLR